MLDRILHGYIELDRSREQLVAEGLPSADVERATRLVDLAEYKRRQAPPGIKITERAFGRDRRMPITNAYRALNVRRSIMLAAILGACAVALALLRRHVPGPADRPRAAGERDRQEPLPRLLAGSKVPRHADHGVLIDPGGAVTIRYGDCL